MTVKDLTIDSIRDQLRSALTHFCLMASMHKLEPLVSGAAKEPHDVARNGWQQIGSNFAVFGVNAGLITLDEANDWKDGLFDKQLWGTVAMKYCPPDPPEEDSEPA